MIKRSIVDAIHKKPGTQKADKPKHFRKGDIGDWRNHFSAEQSGQMDDLFMKKMKDSGLQFDFGDGVILPSS